MIEPGEARPIAEPFQSEPAQLSGCGKPAVIGCLVVLLVVLVALLLLMLKARNLLGWALEEYRSSVVSSLPDNLSDEERLRLDRAFEEAIAAIESGDLDPSALQRLQRVMAAPPRAGEKLKREEVLELIQALEVVAGKESEKGSGKDDLPEVPGIVGVEAGYPLAWPGVAV